MRSLICVPLLKALEWRDRPDVAGRHSQSPCETLHVSFWCPSGILLVSFRSPSDILLCVLLGRLLIGSREGVARVISVRVVATSTSPAPVCTVESVCRGNM